MKNGNYLGAGIEHNEHGDPTASGRVHERMNAKRIHKFDRLRKRDDLFRIEGEASAPLGLISWGSIAGVCREAMALANAEGLQVKLLVPYLLFPVNEGVYRRFFSSMKAGLVVEQSYLGQLYRVLRMMLDVPVGLKSFSRSGANPIQPAEVVRKLQERALDLQQQQTAARQPQE
jgi:2-oxoglutarate ferredoxin oxidoreductase subunit alpha